MNATTTNTTTTDTDYKSLTSAVPVAKVRETPYVAQSNGVSGQGENVILIRGPVPPLLVLVLLLHTCKLHR